MDTEARTHFDAGQVNFDLRVDGCGIAPLGSAVIELVALLLCVCVCVSTITYLLLYYHSFSYIVIPECG